MADQSKKSHPVGTGTGTAAGGLAGMAVGGAVGGPIGAGVGAVVGGIAGAAAGHEVAERVNPDEFTAYWEKTYKSRPYYLADYSWSDYEPAYRYGYASYVAHRGNTFDAVEPELESGWSRAKGKSKLMWTRAREAVRDGWHHVEDKLPGDFDRDSH